MKGRNKVLKNILNQASREWEIFVNVQKYKMKGNTNLLMLLLYDHKRCPQIKSEAVIKELTALSIFNHGKNNNQLLVETSLSSFPSLIIFAHS